MSHKTVLSLQQMSQWISWRQ